MYQAVKMFIPTVMRDILTFESTEEQLTHSSRTLEKLQGGFFFLVFYMFIESGLSTVKAIRSNRIFRRFDLGFILLFRIRDLLEISFYNFEEKI